MTTIKSALFLFAALFLIQCTESSCDVEYGIPFKIKEGETYCLPNGSNLEITLITNSYCPCNANCVWEGEAYVEARLSFADEVDDVVIHETLVDQSPRHIFIDSVTATDDCIRVVEEVFLRVEPCVNC